METTDVYEHSLSAETIANNVDLLTTILLRLPAKYLVRFKCISKHWLSLISDSKFCIDHTRKNLNPTVSGLYVDSRPLINFNTKTQNGQQSLPNLDFINESLHGQSPLRIWQSCNGLLLCVCGATFIVCNPTVQKFKVIPDYKNRSWSLFLSFSPSKSPYFKVVSMSKPVSIYSSESGMWETIDFCELALPHLSRRVFCDGAIYWMVKGNNLLRFDIDAKTMTTHQTSLDPVIFSGGVFSYRILYFRGHGRYLTLIQSTNMPTRTAVQILEMDTRNFRWIIKYDLDLGLRIGPPAVKKWRGDVYVIYLKGGDEEETPALVVAKTTDREIVMYNLKSKRWENILEDLPRDFETRLGIAYEFIESLALV